MELCVTHCICLDSFNSILIKYTVVIIIFVFLWYLIQMEYNFVRRKIISYILLVLS